MLKFSVIIPVYNVRKYLNKCIESVVQQNTPDIEIILVDDGSTDGCDIICDQYAERINNCTVIHQKNKGLSSARNIGLNSAQGEYVYFLDGDDYIEKTLFQRLGVAIDEYGRVDVIGFDAKVLVDDKQVETLTTSNGQYGIQKGLEFAKGTTPKSTVPLYCYRKNFLLENKLKFYEGIYYEDILFTAQVFLKNPYVLIIGDELYCYNKREGSITTSVVNTKKYKDIVKINYILLKESINYNVDKRNAFRNIYKSYLMLSEEIYTDMTREYRCKEKKTRKQFLEHAISYRQAIGFRNYLFTLFPRTFFSMRQLRQTLRRR